MSVLILHRRENANCVVRLRKNKKKGELIKRWANQANQMLKYRIRELNKHACQENKNDEKCKNKDDERHYEMRQNTNNEHVLAEGADDCCTDEATPRRETYQDGEK